MRNRKIRGKTKMLSGVVGGSEERDDTFYGFCWIRLDSIDLDYSPPTARSGHAVGRVARVAHGGDASTPGGKTWLEAARASPVNSFSRIHVYAL